MQRLAVVMKGSRECEGKLTYDENFLKLKETIEEIKLVLRCGICYSTLNDGILTTCNHAFCKKCHAQCFKTLKNLRCPICNQIVNKRSCQPCPSLSAVTKEYLNLAKCFKVDCVAMSVPKEMQFFESQAVCDSQFKPFNCAIPSTSATPSPVFLVGVPLQPQFAPRAKRARLSKPSTPIRKTAVPPKRGTIKVVPSLETIAEVAETSFGSPQVSSEVALQEKTTCNVASQCEEFNFVDEAKTAVSTILDREQNLPVEALIRCLPWIPDFLGLAKEDIGHIIQRAKLIKENVITFDSKEQQTVDEKFPGTGESACMTSNTKQGPGLFISPLLNTSRFSRRRDSLIDVVGLSDREGKEDMDSDATVPMFVDERSRLSDLDHVEQSDKENNGPVHIEGMKNLCRLRVSPECDFFCTDENARNGFDDPSANAVMVDVVGDSLDSASAVAASGTSGCEANAGESEVTSESAAVVYTHKLMISGGIQSDYLAILQQFFVSFRTATLWKDFDDGCTHLVILNTENLRCTKRSIKYAWAIAKSIPVLCRTWLEDSLKKKKILPIENYEIIGDLYCDPESHSSLKSRKSPGSLFRGLTFCLPSTYFKDSHVDRDLLIKMAEASGAQCIQYLWDVHYPKDPQKSYIIFGAGCRDRDAAKRFEEDLKVNVLAAEWILDCLTQFVLYDTCNYRIIDS